MMMFRQASLPARAGVPSRVGLVAGFVLSLGLLGFGLLVTGCTSKDETPVPPVIDLPERPNIVLVVLCSFRQDHTGFGGYSRPTTPFLDRFAAQSVLFEQAFSASSWTKPSAASLYTGLTPNVHQMIDDYPIHSILQGDGKPPRTLPEAIVTLPENLRQAGYATGCRVNNVNAGEFFHLTQGCDDAVTRHRMPTGEMIDDLASFITDLPAGKPFFYLLFSLGAHVPYTPDYEDFLRFNRGDGVPTEDEFRHFPNDISEAMNRAVTSSEPVPEDLKQTYIDLYDASLASLDRRLSRLPEVLAAAGMADDTMVIVTADHGESFFEPGRRGHRQTTHGYDLSEAVIRIPLLIQGPGLTPGQRFPQVVRSIDLFPTLVELARSEAPLLLQGQSLTPLLYGDGGGDGFPSHTAFSSRAVGAHHSVHDGRYKLHFGTDNSYSLFDTQEDPYELRDIKQDDRALTQRLKEALDHWREHEETLRPIVGQAGSRDLTPEMIEQLKSLGYL